MANATGRIRTQAIFDSSLRLVDDQSNSLSPARLTMLGAGRCLRSRATKTDYINPKTMERRRSSLPQRAAQGLIGITWRKRAERRMFGCLTSRPEPGRRKSTHSGDSPVPHPQNARLAPNARTMNRSYRPRTTPPRPTSHRNYRPTSSKPAITAPAGSPAPSPPPPARPPAC